MIDPAIGRILDEARASVVTAGNVNDVANFCVKYGLEETYADTITKALEDYDEGTRVVLVYDTNPAEGADKVISTDNGNISIKK